ncbi:MAG: NTPase [Desulfurococcaceae archaeon]
MLRYIITGKPGVGKSTLFNHVISILKESNYRIGGFIAPEVRDRGYRIGFKVVDLLTNEETWLARKDYHSSVKVGSYGVLLSEADRLIKKALESAMQSSDIIGIDEVGPMELKLPSFKPLLLRILNLQKPVILVIHYNLSDRNILEKIKDAKKIIVTFENREKLRESIPWEILLELRSISKS